ncbi:MAG: response regulator transcription factor [Muribaculaceae bacterium]|nr:response regulator transcription factor [Muribaculaceae bacterium]
MKHVVRCVIVDDEPVAREGIAGYVAKLDWLECVGVFGDAMSLDKFLAERKGDVGTQSRRPVDIIFIDVEMPGMTGLDYISSVCTDAAVIVITAYSEYALRGYELNVTDYLLKPVSFPRFLKAVDKARDYCLAMDRLRGNAVTEEQSNMIFVKSDKIIHRVELSELNFVEGMENYVKLYMSDGVIVTRTPLKKFLGMLPERNFMQVHKSYVVNISRIRSMEGNLLRFDKDLSVPVSRNYKQKLFDKLTLPSSFGDSEC